MDLENGNAAPDNVGVHEALANSVRQINSDENSSPETEGQPLKGPLVVTLDGDQTLYSDGANFDSNPRLAFYLYQLLRHKVAVAVVTAAGYEYNVERYEHRLSGLLAYFQQRGLSEEECGQFYLVRLDRLHWKNVSQTNALTVCSLTTHSSGESVTIFFVLARTTGSIQ